MQNADNYEFGDNGDNYIVNGDGSITWTMTGNITQKLLTLKAYEVSVTKVFDGNGEVELEEIICPDSALDGVVGGETVTISTKAAKYHGSDFNVGKGKSVIITVTLDGTDADNYTIVEQTLNVGEITKAKLTISTLGNYTYNGKDQFEAISGAIKDNIKNNETSVLPSEELIITLATEREVKNVNIYSISVKLSDGDYKNFEFDDAFQTTTVSVTVVQAKVTGITWIVSDPAVGALADNSYNAVYDGITHTITATVNYVGGSESATFADSNTFTDVCDGVKFTITESPNFDFTDIITTLTVTITKAQLAIDPLEEYTYNGKDQFTKVKEDIKGKIVDISGTSVLPTEDELIITLVTETEVKNVDTYSITVKLSDGDYKNFEFESKSQITTVSIKVNPGRVTGIEWTVSDPAAGTLDGNSYNAVYDGKEYTVRAILTLNDSSDTIEIEFSENVIKDAKEYNMTVTDTDNYTVSASNAQFTAVISKKSLTLKSSEVSVTKVYDGTGTVEDAQIKCPDSALDGVIDGDTVTILTKAAKYNGSDFNVGTGKSVTITVTLDGTDADNYMIDEQILNVGEITKAKIKFDKSEVSITASKEYDGNTSVTGVKSDGESITIKTGVKSEEVTGIYTAIYNDKNVKSANQITVTLKLQNADNYEFGDNGDNYTLNGDGSITWTITEGVKINSYVIDSLPMLGSVSYNGMPQTAAKLATLDGVNGEKLELNKDYTVTYMAGDHSGENATDTGNYTVTVALITDGPIAQNYTMGRDVTTTFGIVAFEIELTADEKSEIEGYITKSKVYDGTTDVAVAAEKDYLDRLDEQVGYTLSAKYNDKNVNGANTITVILTLKQTSNFTLKSASGVDSDNNTITWNIDASIEAKKLKVEFEDPTQTYTGSALTPKATVTTDVDGEKVVLTVTLSDGDGYTGKLIGNDAIDAGTYKATAAINEGSSADNALTNYELLEAIQTFTIGKVTANVTITTPTNAKYNGTKQSAIVEVSVVGAPALSENDGYIVIYKGTVEGNETPLNVDTYTVTVKLTEDADKNYQLSGSYSETFTIDKAIIKLPALNSMSYNGKEQQAAELKTSFETGVNNESLTFDMDYTVSYSRGEIAEPKNAGTYTVTVTLKDTITANNYELSSNTAEYTIEKADITFTLNSATGEYTGSTHSDIDVMFEGIQNEEEFTKDAHYILSFEPQSDTTAELEGNLPKNAGKYTVTVTLKDEMDKNYNLKSQTATYTITQKELDKPTGSSVTYTYTGLSREIIIDGFDSNTMQKKSLTEGATFTEESKKFSAKNKGIYILTLELKDNKNYTWKGSDRSDPEFTIEITSAALTFNFANSGNLYNGSECEVKVTFNTQNGETLTEYEDYTIEVKEDTGKLGSTGKPQGAGDYIVTITLVVDSSVAGNYELSASERSKTFTIEKAKLTKPTGDNVKTKYTGAEYKLTLGNFNYNAAIMEYSKTGDSNFATDTGVFSATNASDTPYTLTIKIKDTDNYEWIDGGNDEVMFTITISKADITDQFGKDGKIERAQEYLYHADDIKHELKLKPDNVNFPLGLQGSDELTDEEITYIIETHSEANHGDVNIGERLGELKDSGLWEHYSDDNSKFNVNKPRHYVVYFKIEAVSGNYNVYYDYFTVLILNEKVTITLRDGLNMPDVEYGNVEHTKQSLINAVFDKIEKIEVSAGDGTHSDYTQDWKDKLQSETEHDKFKFYFRTQNTVGDGTQYEVGDLLPAGQTYYLFLQYIDGDESYITFEWKIGENIKRPGFKVVPRKIKITVEVTGHVYGDTDFTDKIKPQTPTRDGGGNWYGEDKDPGISSLGITYKFTSDGGPEEYVKLSSDMSAGMYTVKGECANSNYEVEFTIGKYKVDTAKLTFTLTSPTVEYNGTGYDVDVSFGDSLKNGDVLVKDIDYTVKITETDVPLVDGKPQNVGKYTVTVTLNVESSDTAKNYTITSDSQEFIISIGKVKKPTGGNIVKAYNGTVYELTVNDYVEAQMDYSITGDGANFDGKKFTAMKVGKYTLTITLKENYEWIEGESGEVTFTITIGKATLTITGATVKTKTYDGTETANITAMTFAGIAAVDESEVQFVSCIATFASPNASNNALVNSITEVKLTGAATDNYIVDLKTLPKITGKIEKAKLTIEFTAEKKTYDGTTTVTVTGEISDGKIGSDNVTVGEIVAHFADANVGNSIRVFVDSITFEGTAKDNYTVDLENLSAITSEIEKAGLTVTVSDNNKPYNGETQMATVTVMGINGQSLEEGGYIVTYKLNGEDANVDPLNAGTYHIYITLTGDNATNYNEVTVKEQFTISPVEIGVVWNGGKDIDLTYNGNEQNITATATGVKGELITLSIEYSTRNGSSLNKNHKPQNAGDYKATVTVNVGASGANVSTNYTLSGVTKDFTIKKAIIKLPALNSVSYNGKEQQAAELKTSFETGVNNESLTFDTDYTVSYSRGEITEPKNAGTYTVTVTLKDTITANNYELSSNAAEYIIEKAKLKKPTSNTPTVSGKYNESNYKIEISDFITDKMIAELSDNIKSQFDNTNFTATNAGTYTLTITISDRNNYEWDDVDQVNPKFTIKIDKADNSWQVAPDIKGWIYGNTANDPTGGRATFTYSDSKDGTYKEVKPTNAGTYWLKAEVAGTDNYNALIEKIEFKIDRATLNFTLKSDKTSGTYNRQAHSDIDVDFNNLKPGDVLIKGTHYTLSFGADGDGVLDGGLPKDAGTYTVTVELKTGNELAQNYKMADGASATYTINKAELKKPSGDVSENRTGGSYNGSSYKIAISDFDSATMTATPTLSSQFDDYKNFTATNTGTYTLTITIKDQKNYIWMNGKSDEAVTFSITIDKAELIIKDATVISKTYDGTTTANITEMTFEGIVAVDEGKVQFDSCVAKFESPNANINATVIIIEVTLKGDAAGNYTVKVPHTVNGRIEKADLTVTVSDNNKPYNGEIQRATVIVKGINGQSLEEGGYIVTYKLNGEDANVNPLNAGTYHIYITLIGDNAINYNEATVKEQFTISPITVRVVWNDGEEINFTYDGNTKTITASATGIGGELITLGISYVSNTPGIDLVVGEPLNAGSYTATAYTTNGNYTLEESTKTYSFTIAKRQVDVPTIASTVYNGTPQTAHVEASELYTVEEVVKTNAGNYDVTLTLKYPENYKWPNSEEADIVLTFTIMKADYDMSGVTFESLTVDYDGEEHSILIGGDLPSGVAVTYQGNGQTDVGVYTVTAVFKGDEVNYNPIDPKKAILTILRVSHDLSGIKFEDVTVKYDGETHGIYIEGALPHGVTVTYENNEQVDPNIYTVTAVFRDHIGEFERKTAILTILRLHIQSSDGEVIIDSEDGFDPTLDLVVEKFEDVERGYWAWEKDKVSEKYIVKLCKNGEEVSIGGKVIVRLLIPERFGNKDFELKAVSIATSIEYTRDGDYVIFETNELSVYVFTSTYTPYFPVVFTAIGVMLADVLVLIVLLVILRKKRKTEVK